MTHEVNATRKTLWSHCSTKKMRWSLRPNTMLTFSAYLRFCNEMLNLKFWDNWIPTYKNSISGFFGLLNVLYCFVRPCMKPPLRLLGNTQEQGNPRNGYAPDFNLGHLHRKQRLINAKCSLNGWWQRLLFSRVADVRLLPGDVVWFAFAPHGNELPHAFGLFVRLRLRHLFLSFPICN